MLKHIIITYNTLRKCLQNVFLLFVNIYNCQCIPTETKLWKINKSLIHLAFDLWTFVATIDLSWSCSFTVTVFLAENLSMKNRRGRELFFVMIRLNMQLLAQLVEYLLSTAVSQVWSLACGMAVVAKWDCMVFHRSVIYGFLYPIKGHAFPPRTKSVDSVWVQAV